jgi:large subunit ribosomal protein L22
MTEETKKTVIEKEKTEERKVEKEKVETKKKDVPKKDVAVANGASLRISPKQCVYVCKIIRGKSPGAAIDRLRAVIDEKRPVPMADLEVGHKRGRGLAGGKFPKNACKAVMEIVKQAEANAVVVGIENPVISIAKSDRAAAPFRRAGRKAKRCHVHIEIRNKGVEKK